MLIFPGAAPTCGFCRRKEERELYEGLQEVNSIKVAKKGKALVKFLNEL
jgi:hypothetical protein